MPASVLAPPLLLPRKPDARDMWLAPVAETLGLFEQLTTLHLIAFAVLMGCSRSGAAVEAAVEAAIETFACA